MMVAEKDVVQVCNKTIGGKCSNCGECCTNGLPLSENEVKRIKRFVQSHNIKEQRHNGLTGVDMTCPFRDDANKKCLIYSIRPEVCRKFICSQSVDEITAAKYDLFAKNKVVFMRTEFFNNTEDTTGLFGIINQT